MASAEKTIPILFFTLLCLIALLIFLYKRLNKETNGEYTIRNMVYKEGGVRDRLRGVALALGTRLGVQLWPHDDTEMQEVRDEEAEVQQSDSQVNESETKDCKTEEKEDEQKEEDSSCSDGESSSEDSEADEETRLTDDPERPKKEEEKKVEEEEKMEGEGSGGAEVLVNPNQFSGSAIWSEEQGGKFGEVTPL